MKSEVVFAPAGSGKTECLSQRYLELLKQGVKPERILTITFTDKAATEMKERILKRAAAGPDPGLSALLRENILKLRISTIHSFCFSLVRRFAHLVGIEPNPTTLVDSAVLWEQKKYDTLMKIAEDPSSPDYNLLLELITDETRAGWGKLERLLGRLFEHRTRLEWWRRGEVTRELQKLKEELRHHPAGAARIPEYHTLFPEELDDTTIRRLSAQLQLEAVKSRFLRKDNAPLKSGLDEEGRRWAEKMALYRNLILAEHAGREFHKQVRLLEQFLAAYKEAKQERGQIDFADMEIFAYELINRHEEWQNILYAFDEKTDHILVDEFQDTSLLQWEIIDKLTEEWRAGAGAKTERGITPTIFIVGDDKQSIYSFRGANVEVFIRAAEKLRRWLGSAGLKETQKRDNYRSLPAIIDFTNTLFSRLMPNVNSAPSWRTRYADFVCRRNSSGTGRVELLLLPVSEKVGAAERRELEAKIIARRISSLVAEQFPVWRRRADGTETPEPCRYQDIALLIRDRNPLSALEKQLRAHSIPFLVIGGTGFYEEEEVRYLTALTNFLIDPADDFALYITLRGPIFSIPEKDLFLFSTALPDSGPPLLWERIRRCAGTGTARPRGCDQTPLAHAQEVLEETLAQVNLRPLHLLLEELLTRTHAWERFCEPQRAANVKKFIRLIQDMELAGMHPFRIKKFLELENKDEARADVTTTGMDCVQIMTVHNAKGLQFPIVFHPGLHEPVLSSKVKQESLIIAEKIEGEGPGVTEVFYLPDKAMRKSHPAYQEWWEKQLEEEKRIFYVACTRAQDALFLTGLWMAEGKNRAAPSKLDWLKTHLALNYDGADFRLGEGIKGVYCINAATIPAPPSPTAEKPAPAPPVDKRETPIRPITDRISTVTRHTPEEHSRHGPEHILMGDAIHHLLELFSRGELRPEDPGLRQEVARVLHQRRVPRAEHERLIRTVLHQVSALRSSPVWEVVKPQPDSFAELPILYTDGDTLWSGRIDRVLVDRRAQVVHIYDYKTFPVQRTEIPDLKRMYYESQLVHYARAARELFPGMRIKLYLVFTALTLIEPVEME